MRDMFSETQFEPRKSHLKWQQSVLESQGGSAGGHKPAGFPSSNDKKNGSSKGNGSHESYAKSHDKFGHDKPSGRGGDYDHGGTIFLGKYHNKPPDKGRQYRIPHYTEMTPKQMKIAGKVLDERFDVRSLLV